MLVTYHTINLQHKTLANYMLVDNCTQTYITYKRLNNTEGTIMSDLNWQRRVKDIYKDVIQTCQLCINLYKEFNLTEDNTTYSAPHTYIVSLCLWGSCIEAMVTIVKSHIPNRLP